MYEKFDDGVMHAVFVLFILENDRNIYCTIPADVTLRSYAIHVFQKENVLKNGAVTLKKQHIEWK